MVVVDTNVAVVANRDSQQASPNCEKACIDRLERIIRGEDKLVLDDQREILGRVHPKSPPLWRTRCGR